MTRSWLQPRLVGALAGALALASLTGGPGVQAATRGEVQRIVVEESLRAGFPPTLAMAVAEVGSDFHDHATGPGGARGVMQIRPATAEKLYGVASDELWDARLNVRIGIDYLESLIRENHGRWEDALARFRGSPDRQAESEGQPADSASFAGKVLRAQRRYRNQSSLWAEEAAINNVRADEAPPVTSQTRGLAPSEERLPQGLETGIFDDFQNAIELRRRAARRQLDDFADIYRWSPPANAE